MAQAKAGDTVKVHYTGTLDDGTVFDTSAEREPLEFTLGEGTVIPGFEKAVTGMKPSETKSFKILAADAYGSYRQEMVLDVDRDQFPADLQPEVGQRLQVGQGEGDSIVVTVAEVTEEKVTLDANHPLAGKDLIFEVKLVEIV